MYSFYATQDLAVASQLPMAEGDGLGCWVNYCHGLWHLVDGSMHYIGMLAFRMPVPVWYEWPAVLISFILAIFSDRRRGPERGPGIVLANTSMR